MSLDFSAMHLIVNENSPSYEVLYEAFKVDTEERDSIDKEHFIINKKTISNNYFWLNIRYGKELPYTTTVINTKNAEEELNPRSKDQVEPDKQFFGLYSAIDQIFYISDVRKKAFFENYLAKKLNQSITIKSFLKSPEDFLKIIKSVEKIKLVTKKTLFSMSGGLVSISPEYKDIFGLGVPEEYSIEATYKHAKLTDAFKENIINITGWKKTSEAESLVCIGRDENNLETIFNVDSFRQKISISIEKDADGMYDSEAVLSLLQLKLESK